MSAAMKAALVVAVAGALGRIASPGPTADAADPDVARVRGVLTVHDMPFTGVLVSHDAADHVREAVPYRNGLRDGTARAWYVDGRPAYRRHYRHGREAGHHVGWWENGQRRFDYHFDGGVLQGEAREWLEDGTPYRDFHYVDGHESGSQRLWNPDGTLRANYVVKDGRRYGLMGSKGCVQNDTAGSGEAAA
jgi:antitoxin component YwqK of YwqJK toxin-antitoxin module